MAFQPRKGQMDRYRRTMKRHDRRLLRAFLPHRWGDLTHAYVNLWVESARADPYIHGHLEVFLQIAVVALLVLL